MYIALADVCRKMDHVTTTIESYTGEDIMGAFCLHIEQTMEGVQLLPV